jgi:proteasome lid subunit RPN8/RPN11
MLTFAPTAWLKLQYFCHRGDTEIGGFGVTAAGRPLYIEEFVTIPQVTSLISVSFHDDAVADYFDTCVDQGLTPDRFARIWLHTHPGASVTPSSTDEDTFERVFGPCDWAVMAILGRTGRTYARLRTHSGPRIDVELPTRVDWAVWPDDLAIDAMPFDLLSADWHTEYTANIVASDQSHPRLDGWLDPFVAAPSPEIATWQSPRPNSKPGVPDEPPF